MVSYIHVIRTLGNKSAHSKYDNDDYILTKSDTTVLLICMDAFLEYYKKYSLFQKKD